MLKERKILAYLVNGKLFNLPSVLVYSNKQISFLKKRKLHLVGDTDITNFQLKLTDWDRQQIIKPSSD